nr:zeb2-regulated abc transporter 1 [Quercus suber]
MSVHLYADRCGCRAPVGLGGSGRALDDRGVGATCRPTRADPRSIAARPALWPLSDRAGSYTSDAPLTLHFSFWTTANHRGLLSTELLQPMEANLSERRAKPESAVQYVDHLESQAVIVGSVGGPVRLWESTKSAWKDSDSSVAALSMLAWLIGCCLDVCSVFLCHLAGHRCSARAQHSPIMSLVGNFAFGNFDHQAEVAGAGPDGAAFQDRAERTDEDVIAENDAIHTTSYQTHHSSHTTTTTTTRHEAHGLEKDALEESESSTSRKDSDLDEEKSQARVDYELHQLAKSMSKNSTWSQIPDNPLTAGTDSELDPHSPNFKARSWAKSMIKLRDAENKNPGRTAGFAFRNLSAHGFGAATDYQKDVSNIWLEVIEGAKTLLGMVKPRRIDILRNFDGLVEAGEMLVVLGPPGSGCSTFLKTITGETHGFQVDKDSYLNYQGIPADHMHKYFRGEAIYTAEVDVHFPMLTVGDTLYFAARARSPRSIPGNVNKATYATHMRDVTMATFGISHTLNTRVGNDFVRGVSGGERKRVSIAEAFLSGSPLQAWDNSTRGLDSANAIEFCKTLRLSCEMSGTAACVAIYQAPQSAYDIFDKALVLYEGRQIYFGKTTEARQYFERMGFQCPDRQTDADFLTSMTSAQERIVRKGFEDQVPRTPDEFAARWKSSTENARLLEAIEAYNQKYPLEGEGYQQFVASRKAQQSRRQRLKSPYTLDYMQQVQLCLWRGFRRLIGDPSLTFTQLFGNLAMALILGSVFFNLGSDTNSFYQRGAVLFFAILMNAFGSALEILTLYAQRPIVEKHSRYALYHPSAEAFASMLTDMPYKIMNAITFNLALYFMVNLRREPGAYFFFMFVSFITTLVMSMLFRTIASFSRTLAQAMAPAALIILAIVIFTGFAIPVNYMLGWCRWINYIDPVAYAFEALMINEFHNHADKVPSQTQVCNAVGAVAGQAFVNGDNYINSSFQYYASHKWRNVGIIFAFTVFLMCLYLGATEFISAKKSKGEVLLFRRGHTPASLQQKSADVESADAGEHGGQLAKQEKSVEASEIIQKQTAVFSWKDVCYDIKIKSEERRILDHVDGWVKPGTLTALMG